MQENAKRNGGRKPLTYDPKSEIVRQEHVPIAVGVSKETVWRWRKAGQFVPTIKLGQNSVGFRRTDIDAWLAQRSR